MTMEEGFETETLQLEAKLILHRIGELVLAEETVDGVCITL